MTPQRLVVAYCGALLLNMAGFANIGVVLPAVSQELGLDPASAGLLGGAFFAAYAIGVPIFVPLTDRWLPLRIYAAGSACWIAGALCVAGAQDGLALPLAGRVLSGLGMAATYMPGLVMLVAQVEEQKRSGAAATYASCITLGTAFSFAVTGTVALLLPWRACFLAAAVCAAMALPLVITASRGLPMSRRAGTATPGPGSLGFLRRPHLLGWLAACAGNAWEGMALRTWWIAFLVFCIGTPPSGELLTQLAIATSLAGLIAMPISVAVARRARGSHRLPLVAAICVGSGLFAAVPPLLAGQSLLFAIVLTTAYLCIVFADSGTLSAAIIDNSPAERRGAALAAAATASNTGAFGGATAVGLVLHLAGGPASPLAWLAAFLTMGAGSIAGALCLVSANRRRERGSSGPLMRSPRQKMRA